MEEKFDTEEEMLELEDEEGINAVNMQVAVRTISPKERGSRAGRGV